MPRLVHPTLGTALLIGSLAMASAQTNSSSVTAGSGGVSGNTTVTNNGGKPCRVVHSDDANNTGTLSSSVTAGPDGVKASTTGGPSVTTRSGDGRSSSTVTAGSSSSSGGSVTTSSGDGDCVVTVPGSKK